MTFLAVTIGYAAFVAIATVLLHRIGHGWPQSRIVAIASLSAPALVLAAAGAGVADILRRPTPADEIDASGMAMMVYLVGGGIVAGMMLAVGVPASRAVLHRIRAAGVGSKL